MMTFWTQARMMLAASVALWAPFAVALAQDDASLSNGPEATPSAASLSAGQEKDVSGFWGWVEKNISVEYPDEQSEENQRPRSGDGGGGSGGGGDSGGGGGHGG